MTALYNYLHRKFRKKNGKKVLFLCAAGNENKELLRKTVERFRSVDCDFWIFQWEDFKNPLLGTSDDIRYFMGRGIKWNFFKKSAAPLKVLKYDYIFAWDDDIDILDFNPSEYLKIVRKNRLEMSQPALDKSSYSFHEITLHSDDESCGRLTDFVEVMVPVYTFDAWCRFWKMMRRSWNAWGWGYDEFARSICGFKNMGIVDRFPVRHIKPLRDNPLGRKDHKRFRASVKNRYKESEKKVLGSLENI